MTLPFNKTPGVLSYEDLDALDEYYCHPYYNRDSSKISHIKEYDWVQRHHQDEIKNEIIFFAEKINRNEINLSSYLTNEIIDQINNEKPHLLKEIFFTGLDFAI